MGHMYKVWSCENCSHKSGNDCVRKNGCYFLPAIVRLEELFTGERAKKPPAFYY